MRSGERGGRAGGEEEEQWLEAGDGDDDLFIRATSRTANQEGRREESIGADEKQLQVCNAKNVDSLKQRRRRPRPTASKQQQMIIVLINNDRDQREAPIEKEQRTGLMLVCVARCNSAAIIIISNTASAKVAVSLLSSFWLHLFCICCCHKSNSIKPLAPPPSSSCANYCSNSKGRQEKRWPPPNEMIIDSMEPGDRWPSQWTNNCGVNDDKERNKETPAERISKSEPEKQTRLTRQIARALWRFVRKTQPPKGPGVLIREVIDEHCSGGAAAAAGRLLNHEPLSDYVSCKMAEGAGELPLAPPPAVGLHLACQPVKSTRQQRANKGRRYVRRVNNNDNIINERRRRSRRRRRRGERGPFGRQSHGAGCGGRPLGPARAATLLWCLLAATLITLTLTLNSVAEAVDCFKCSSRNGSNPACEDPFHNLNTTRVSSPVLPDPSPSVIYHTPCYAGKKGREGLFPASACIKLTGTFDTTGETLVVRHCALDSGTLTQDTELARMSHCGKFQFEGDLLKGCVLACPEDACNSAPPSTGPLIRSSSSPATFIVSPAMALILLRLLRLV